MKPVLIFGTIIVGARVSEMLNEFTQIPTLTILECIVLVVAFSILAFGIYDYNRMLQRK